MGESFLFRVTRVKGTAAHNVGRTAAYAAEQLGLAMKVLSSDACWTSFSARLTGEPGQVSRLIGLVELAFPTAVVTVEPLTPHSSAPR